MYLKEKVLPLACVAVALSWILVAAASLDAKARLSPGQEQQAYLPDKHGDVIWAHEIAQWAAQALEPAQGGAGYHSAVFIFQCCFSECFWNSLDNALSGPLVLMASAPHKRCSTTDDSRREMEDNNGDFTSFLYQVLRNNPGSTLKDAFDRARAMVKGVSPADDPKFHCKGANAGKLTLKEPETTKKLIIFAGYTLEKTHPGCWSDWNNVLAIYNLFTDTYRLAHADTYVLYDCETKPNGAPVPRPMVRGPGTKFMLQHAFQWLRVAMSSGEQFIFYAVGHGGVAVKKNISSVLEGGMYGVYFELEEDFVSAVRYGHDPFVYIEAYGVETIPVWLNDYYIGDVEIGEDGVGKLYFDPLTTPIFEGENVLSFYLPPEAESWVGTVAIASGVQRVERVIREPCIRMLPYMLSSPLCYTVLPNVQGKPLPEVPVINAQATDWTAAGYFGGVAPYDVTVYDNSPEFFDLEAGILAEPGSVLVLFGGRVVNIATWWYETVTQEDEVYAESDGSLVWFTSRTFGRIEGAEVGFNELEHRDLFLIEVFNDSQGRTVVKTYGVGWRGTFAAALWFNNLTNKSGICCFTMPAELSFKWVIVEWLDVNSNGDVDDPGVDSYSIVAHESLPDINVTWCTLLVQPVRENEWLIEAHAEVCNTGGAVDASVTVTFEVDIPGMGVIQLPARTLGMLLPGQCVEAVSSASIVTSIEPGLVCRLIVHAYLEPAYPEEDTVNNYCCCLGSAAG